MILKWFTSLEEKWDMQMAYPGKLNKDKQDQNHNRRRQGKLSLTDDFSICSHTK